MLTKTDVGLLAMEGFAALVGISGLPGGSAVATILKQCIDLIDSCTRKEAWLAKFRVRLQQAASCAKPGCVS